MNEKPEVDFGTFLRQARERRGISLQQVAATTKISARVLGALERNDPSKLPGGIFARAFVRAYAQEVGLDPESTVVRFVTEFPESGGRDEGPDLASGEDAESFESGRRAAMTLLQLVGISVLIVVAALIYFGTRGSSDPAPVPSEAPSVQRAPAPPPAVILNQGSGPLGAAGRGLTPSPEPPPPQAAPTSTAPLTLVVVASDQCWVSLTVDGTEVVSRILEAGERLDYGAQTAMTLKAGNAGALQLTVNGRRGRPFGEAGQVVTRTITPATVAEFIQQQ